MIKDRKFRSGDTLVADQEDDPQTSSENGSDSPLSGNDFPGATVPKKSRRSVKKRVVAVPIGDGDGSRSRGEAYPPSDSWSWRKYGQKPIKGSPYPRGYYRCSSSKGCPARKQVERSHTDPSKLIISYASEHNHPFPTSRHHHAAVSSAAASASNSFAAATSRTPSSSVPTSTSSADEEKEGSASAAATALQAGNFPSDERNLFTGLGDDYLLCNAGDFSWLSDASMEGPALAGPRWDEADVAMIPIISSMREEDESLFADLDELPECSAVFRHGASSIDWGTFGAAPPLCGST
ncbi:hypothetical protein Nepgr_009140 [Nepenthes gracilis]|uniref:WRKY domain-containing protein n=1 Tax=Nepenthes gracilis TaxID=150966 RepID=A0AAD3SAA6_NEPGR|nr:hypothetical protein Nepgr_009140 [Nepenthes gracilis]